MTREMKLLFLFRRWARRNPALPPSARKLWAKAHVFAAARCCAAVPDRRWAGTLLVSATSQIPLPICWVGPTVGTMRSHARDCGGVTAHSLRILAEVTCDHDPDFGVGREASAAEITTARRWACAHAGFVGHVLHLSTLLPDLEVESELAHCFADRALENMELRDEEPATEQVAA